MTPVRNGITPSTRVGQHGAADAGSYSFTDPKFGKSTDRFWLDRRVLETELTEAAIQQGNFKPYLTNAPGLNITQWQRSSTPQLNGTNLPLYKGERSQGLAIAPDNQ